MEIIAVTNQKGGVGKTTTVANLGAALAEMGRKVLVVDLDPQANLTLSCGVSVTEEQVTTHEVIMEREVSAKEGIVTTGQSGLWLIPAAERLAAAPVLLVSQTGRNERLREKLRRVRGYDFVLIDTPPSLSSLTLNALTAADWALIPVQASYLALYGLRQLMQSVDAVREHGNPSLRVGGVVVTMYDGRTIHAQEVRERLRERFGSVLFETTIRRSVAFDYATVAGQPLVCYQPSHPCAQAYRELAKEVIARA